MRAVSEMAAGVPNWPIDRVDLKHCPLLLGWLGFVWHWNQCGWIQHRWIRSKNGVTPSGFDEVASFSIGVIAAEYAVTSDGIAVAFKLLAPAPPVFVGTTNGSRENPAQGRRIARHCHRGYQRICFQPKPLKVLFECVRSRAPKVCVRLPRSARSGSRFL